MTCLVDSQVTYVTEFISRVKNSAPGSKSTIDCVKNYGVKLWGREWFQVESSALKTNLGTATMEVGGHLMWKEPWMPERAMT